MENLSHDSLDFPDADIFSNEELMGETEVQKVELKSNKPTFMNRRNTEPPKPSPGKMRVHRSPELKREEPLKVSPLSKLRKFVKKLAVEAPPSDKKPPLGQVFRRASRMPKRRTSSVDLDNFSSEKVSVPDGYTLVLNKSQKVVQKDGMNMKFVIRKLNTNEANF